jgi:hypothetical protein
VIIAKFLLRILGFMRAEVSITSTVIPAQAGIHVDFCYFLKWIPACAGMTMGGELFGFR